MGVVVSITNQKGGVGKTLTATSLASILTARGYRVLSIDLDPQCNFDQVAGGPGPIDQYDMDSISVLHVLNQEARIEDAIVRTEIGDLVRATPNLSQWTGRNMLSRKDFREFIAAGITAEELFRTLKYRYDNGWGATEHETLAWEMRGIVDQYDFILMDTNPSLTLLTLNALYAADYVLIPAFTEESSMKAILELESTMKQLKKTSEEMHAKIMGILITKYKKRTLIAANYTEVFESLAAKLDTVLFKTKIREGIAVIEHGNQKKDVISYAPKSPVSQDYQQFADEFLKRIDALEGVKL